MKSKKIIIISMFVLFAFTLVSGVADASAVRPRKQDIASSQNIVIEPDMVREVVVNTVARQQVPVQRKVLQTAFVIIVGYLFMFLLIGFGNRKLTNIKIRHIFRRNVVYSVHGSIFVLTFFIWMQSLNSITIFLGVASAGLALALQEVILCVAGWALIMVRHPFEVGDRIEIKGIKGDIIDIRLFQTSLLEIGNWVDADQSTGRIVNVPNSFVFKAENFNYSRGFEFIWNEIPILVTFESDWKRAKEIMILHVDKLADGMETKVRRKIDAMKNRYMIYYETITPIVYVNIKDSGVELTIRYLTEAKKRRSSQDKLCQSILEDFNKEPNVNFAYPTYRIIKD
ncbi:MAG: mechanosensitive ion channel family protein [Candidatus Omnitrophica bacterium]|nr:mechanosensitive ion channel family protein [Candidatus Omnitrophota bacterium]MBU1995534.1 mechanosensitive ion channel family protein [Candidatus Omnitrophota bacterium]MBU4334433.1 mechanosensitive ion channel family protein [Candidatus Omnitrophota bacterium]